MKTKTILLASLLLLTVTISKAQAYAGFGVGYGMPIVGTVLGYNSKDNSSANTFSTENVKGSFGKGLNFGAYFGYMFGEHIGFELGGNYLTGSIYTFKSNDVNGVTSTDGTDEVWVESLRLNPSVRIGIDDGKIRPYMRGGLTIGVMNKMTDRYTRTDINPGGTDITLETTEYTGGTSLGFSGGLGITFTLKGNFSIYTEVTNYFCSWGATNGKITKSTFNGSDELGNMTTDQKEFEYVDKIDQSMNTSSSQPSKQLRDYVPMSSFGISAGVHFAFGGSN